MSSAHQRPSGGADLRVRPARALEGELEPVGDRVERLQRRPVGVGDVRVAVPVDHQEGELGHVDERRRAPRSVELCELLLGGRHESPSASSVGRPRSRRIGVSPVAVREATSCGRAATVPGRCRCGPRSWSSTRTRTRPRRRPAAGAARTRQCASSARAGTAPCGSSARSGCCGSRAARSWWRGSCASSRRCPGSAPELPLSVPVAAFQGAGGRPVPLAVGGLPAPARLRARRRRAHRRRPRAARARPRPFPARAARHRPRGGRRGRRAPAGRPRPPGGHALPGRAHAGAARPPGRDRAVAGAGAARRRARAGAAASGGRGAGDLPRRPAPAPPPGGDDGELSGVIDWIDVCRADPAIDLPLYWGYLTPAGRAAFHAEYGPVAAAALLRARVLAVFLWGVLAEYAGEVDMPALGREALAGLHRTVADLPE